MSIWKHACSVTEARKGNHISKTVVTDLKTDTWVLRIELKSPVRVARASHHWTTSHVMRVSYKIFSLCVWSSLSYKKNMVSGYMSILIQYGFIFCYFRDALTWSIILKFYTDMISGRCIQPTSFSNNSYPQRICSNSD